MSGSGSDPFPPGLPGEDDDDHGCPPDCPGCSCPHGRLPSLPPSLVPVLPDDIGCDVALRLAVPRTLAETPKVRVILDSLEAMLALATSPEAR